MPLPLRDTQGPRQRKDGGSAQAQNALAVMFIGHGQFAGLKQVLQSYKPTSFGPPFCVTTGKRVSPVAAMRFTTIRKGSSGNATTGAFAIT